MLITSVMLLVIESESTEVFPLTGDVQTIDERGLRSFFCRKAFKTCLAFFNTCCSRMCVHCGTIGVCVPKKFPEGLPTKYFCKLPLFKIAYHLLG